ncbi:MAG TPA: biopolymer transporter ExbD [Burkholderiaceae bacterium]|nr:biopolymer transporter ExbD [Burkholderiaceae bacterium]
MRFRRRRAEEPEINLIPFIDVLLVILIFLMLSTTYSKYSELQVTLPTADADRIRERPAEIIVSVSADGRYVIDKKQVEGRSVDILTLELQAAAAGKAEPVVIVSADALSAHQAVINVLDAARRAGLGRLTFAAQVPGEGGSR